MCTAAMTGSVSTSGRFGRFGQRLAMTILGVSALLLSAVSQADVLFEETFSSGLGQFTSAGSVTITTSGARMAGSFGGTDGRITSTAISTVGFDTITLTFTRSTTGLDSGEAGIAEFSTNGTTYTVLESVQTASGARTVTLPASAANQSALRLRFRINASLSSEYYTVDSIRVDGTTGGGGGGGGTLPPVTSVETNGPFAVTITQSTGPTRAGWLVRPTNLGQNGLRHPVFVWGPGAGATPSSYQDHLTRIASHGFVVYSEVSTSTGSEIRAALDWLIAENSRSASVLYQKLDLNNFGAGGHSRGSISTFAAATHPALKTTIHVAGGSFDGNGPRNLRNPAAYICGENDTSATSNCRRDYTNTTVPVFFTVMDNVGHIDAARAGLPAIVGWLRWHLGEETERRSMFLGAGCYFCTGMWVSQSKNW